MQHLCQLLEREDNKLLGWIEKLLSNTWNEILLKTVTQAIPTYTMSIFQLSNALCEEMTSMVRKLWWVQSNERTKMV